MNDTGFNGDCVTDVLMLHDLSNLIRHRPVTRLAPDLPCRSLDVFSKINHSVLDETAICTGLAERAVLRRRESVGELNEELTPDLGLFKILGNSLILVYHTLQIIPFLLKGFNSSDLALQDIMQFRDNLVAQGEKLRMLLGFFRELRFQLGYLGRKLRFQLSVFQTQLGVALGHFERL